VDSPAGRERCRRYNDGHASKALGSWLAMLEHEELVVAFRPMAPRFVYVAKDCNPTPASNCRLRYRSC
jgi:hypothetical protein